MMRERGSSVLLITVLIASVALLVWSVASTWQASRQSAVARSRNSTSAENLPPRLGSDEAKASLFYPVMKSRGPQPGGKLVVRALDGPRGP